MANAKVTLIKEDGAEEAQSPDYINFTDGLDVTVATDGGVDVGIEDLGVSTAKLAANAVTTAKITDANVTPAKTNIVQAVTATADGTGTGVISDTATFVSVTSANADHIVTLPTPTVGRMVWINVGATGFELRSSAPSTVLINGGTGGAAVESAIAANSTVLAICISTTAWKAIFLDADADVAKVEAAA